MQLTAQIHQPSMKVFTVGMDDKGVKADFPDPEKGKASPTSTPVLSPILLATPISPKKHRSFKGVLACCSLVVLALLVAITLSEIAYHRQRDDAYFRLKWAELKQRMIGMDLIRAQVVQQNVQALQQQRILSKSDEMEQRPPIVDERLAFSQRLNSVDRAAQKAVSAAEERAASTAQPREEVTPVDVRFAFLRALMEKMRERAQEAGVNGKMHVSVFEVRRPENEEEGMIGENEEQSMSPDSEAFKDGFGEVAAPHPLASSMMGQWRRDEEYGERLPASDFFGPNWEHPSQFLPRPIRPWEELNRDGESMFIPRPWEQPQIPYQEQKDAHPEMRITHHFDESKSNPSRVVTELYGDAGKRMMSSLLAGQTQPSLSIDSPGSSFPRWEADNSISPKPWQIPQGLPLFIPQSRFDPIPPQFMMPQPSPFFFPERPQQPFPFMSQNLPLSWNRMTPEGGMAPHLPLSWNRMAPEGGMAPPLPQSWNRMAPEGGMAPPPDAPNTLIQSLPHHQAAQSIESLPSNSFQPLPQEVHHDDSAAAAWGSEAGTRIGESVKEAAVPRLPFGAQELPNNDAVEVTPVKDGEGLQQLPWYVPRGFEHERPAWANNDAAKEQQDAPVILPHPSAAELNKGTQTEDDTIHSGQVSGVNTEWKMNAWQKTQSAPSQPDTQPSEIPEPPRSRLPERDIFDDAPPPETHMNYFARDDVDPSRVLFQVDEPLPVPA